MNWIYRVNRWYDDLDDTHPNLRFLLFFIPAGILLGMITQSYSMTLTWIGLTGFGIGSILRILYFYRPRKS